jgi:hypothetical protein
MSDKEVKTVETKKEPEVVSKLTIRKTTSGFQFWNGTEYVGAISGDNLTNKEVQERATQIERKLGL